MRRGMSQTCGYQTRKRWRGGSSYVPPKFAFLDTQIPHAVNVGTELGYMILLYDQCQGQRH